MSLSATSSPSARAARPVLSVVICTLDEADSIGGVLRDVAEVLGEVAHEIIVVDDSAREATGAVVRAHAATNPNIKLIRRQGARGLASAAIAGWDAAAGDVLGIMDGDGQHDPGLLVQLLQRLDAEDADLAVASRYADPGPSGLTGLRHWISRAGTVATHLTLGARTSDPMSGLFLMRRAWFEAVRPRLSGVGFKILVDVIASARARPRTVEVPTALRARTGGRSKLDARVILDLAGLLAEKRTGGLLPARFVLFGLVGATGVVVHLSVLGLMRLGAPSSGFWLDQAVAILAAMTSNFFLNDALTFRDVRVKDRPLWLGLLAFYAACAGGGLLNEAIGAAAARLGLPWALAGALGALAGAAWNYYAGGKAAWGETAAGAPAPEAGLDPERASSPRP